MIRPHCLKSAVAVALAAASTSALANGLAINEQSASSMGAGFAGRSSAVLDASIVYGNPAGMSQLKRPEISGGFALIEAKTEIDDARGVLPGTNEGDMVPFTPVPFAYHVTPLNDRWHAGFGVYVPFGVISDYESTFQGRYYGEYSSVRVVTFQPTLSYQVNDRVSIGFGPTINRIDGKLTRAVALPPAPDGRVSILGDDIGYGFNAGVMVEMTDDLTWGLTYRSKVDYTLEGRTKVTGFPGPAAAVNGQYDATLDFTSPESVDTSLTYQLDDNWTLYGGLTWMRWSRLEEIVVENEGVPGPFAGRFDTVREEQNWSDTWSFALGTSYQLNRDWVLRTGFAWDRSPTTDADRTVRIPVGNRRIFSLGAGWNLSDDITIDAAYAYLHEDTAEVSEPLYQAEYRNSAHGVSTQLTYRF